jgi:CRISPR-associated protein Cas2
LDADILAYFEHIDHKILIIILTRVMNLLRDYGHHVQYSVFECRLEPRQIRKLKNGLSLHIDPTDSIRIYYLCKDEVDRVDILGTGDRTPEDLFYLH